MQSDRAALLGVAVTSLVALLGVVAGAGVGVPVALVVRGLVEWGTIRRRGRSDDGGARRDGGRRPDAGLAARDDDDPRSPQ